MVTTWAIKARENGKVGGSDPFPLSPSCCCWWCRLAAALMADNLGEDLLSGVPFNFSTSDIAFKGVQTFFQTEKQWTSRRGQVFQNSFLLCCKVFVYFFLSTTRLSRMRGTMTNVSVGVVFRQNRWRHQNDKKVWRHWFWVHRLWKAATLDTQMLLLIEPLWGWGRWQLVHK